MLSNIYIDFKAIINTSSLEEFFSINNYNNILTQKQIEIFNAVIGGKKTRMKNNNQRIQPIYKRIQPDK